MSEFPQATPPSYPPPLSSQPRGHAGVWRDPVFPTENDARNDRPDEDWLPADILPPVENTAVQPKHPQCVEMGYYDTVNDLSLHERHDPAINNYAGAALGVPAQAQAVTPDPEIEALGDAALNVAAGPAPAFLDELPHQGPVPNVHVNELLRQLAILYLHGPNSQIAVIRMEPGPGRAHGVRVHITLDVL